MCYFLLLWGIVQTSEFHHAESEYEKYRIVQDTLYESDFDKLLNERENPPIGIVSVG